MQRKKILDVGKASLMMVLASAMSLGMYSGVYAQEDAVKEEPVLEEAAIKETTQEEAVNAQDVTEETTQPANTEVVAEANEAAPLAESSLSQSTSYAPGYTDSGLTAEELKAQLGVAIQELETLWETNGGYNYYKNNVTVNQIIDKTLPKAKQYFEEGNSTDMTFSWRLYEIKNAINSLNSDSNILSELQKEIYALNAEMESLDSSHYTAASWQAYAAMVNEAMTKANGSGTSDERYQQYIDDIKALKEALIEVDPNLITLKDFVKECKAVAYDNYTRESWQNLGAAIAQAEEELNKNQETIDEDVFNTLYDGLQKAKDGLVKASSFGAEYGIDEYWLKKASINDGTYVYEGNSKVRGGQLYVSGEVVNGDGTTTLTITWINNGVNPVTGGLFHNTYYGAKEEYSLRPFTESDWEQNDEWWIDVSGSLITIDNVPDLYLTPDEYDGCTKTVVVPTGTTVDLELQSWGNIGTSVHDTARTYSLGTYYTLNNTSEALQDAVKNSEAIINDADSYAQDENWNAFMEAYQNANAVLEKGQEASQDEVNTATQRLEDAMAQLQPASTTPETPDVDKPEQAEDTKEEADKEDKKDEKVDTAVSTNVQALGMVMTVSAAGAAVLKGLKNRKKD